MHDARANLEAAMEVGVWLRSLGLERYEAAFRDNAIDDQILPNLTAEDLKDLGVAIVGHRRKLLDAIAALRADATLKALPSEGFSPVGRSAKDTAERRQLTIMFCDLVGSTPLSTRYDPEDLREIVGAYHDCVAAAVTRFAGFVAKYMGDGVLVYFGYPEAHEDDAERAVRAGLAVIEAIGRLATATPLSVRVGIASGLVVVGDLIGMGAAQERGVVGETANLAARLQALAQAGTLVIAASTRRQIGALFEIEDLGAHLLPGFAHPQRAWRVLGESGVMSRFEALRGEALTPLVGREEEIELLLGCWRRATAGNGQVVLVSGEAGIGKSRLVGDLHDRLMGKPHTRLRYFCSPHHQDSALYPFISQLERAAGFAREDTVNAKLEKLEALLAPASPPPVDFALLAELLSLPAEALSAAWSQPAAEKRQNLRGVAAAARNAGGEAARAFHLRGPALDGRQFARASQADDRPRSGPAGVDRRDPPIGIRPTMGSAAACLHCDLDPV
jgi:class 3 adenylate cyclase